MLETNIKSQTIVFHQLCPMRFLCHVFARLQDQSPKEKTHLTTMLEVEQLMAVKNEEHTSQNYTSNVTGSIQKKVNILYRHFQLS